MKLHFLLYTVIVSLLLLLQDQTVAAFHWNRLESVSLGSGPLVLTTPANVPSDTGFVQLQAHLGPQQPPVILSLSTRPDFGPLYTARGRYIGLVSMDVGIANWYLRVDNASMGTNVTAWLVFVAKAWDEPIPGGCDLTSPVANPPSLASSQLSPGVSWRLSFALADSFTSRHAKEPCNASLRKGNLRYRLYSLALRSYASEDWRAGLERMATAQEAVVYGRLLTEEEGKPPKVAQFDIGSRPSVPVMYTVVVEQTDTGQFSAYVPVTLDDCQGGGGGYYDVAAGDALSRCALGAPIQWRVATIAATVLGLFLCTMGFRYFSLSVLVCGFAAGALLVLPATLRALSADQQWLAYLLGAGAAGLLVGVAALAVWLKCKSTVLALLFVHVPCCYLLACLAFFTPFGQLWWVMREEYIFFMSLAVLILLCLLVLLLFSNVGAIFSLSLVGTFTVAVCVSANLLIGSFFPYIFLDLFRRTAYKGYNQVHLAFSLHLTADWILLACWAASFLLCCMLQYCCNRRSMDPALRAGRGGGRRRCRDSLDELPPGMVSVDTERTPLLQGDARRSPPPGYTVDTRAYASRME